MAKTLSAFLAQNVKKAETHKYVATDRIIGEDGKPIPWEYGCITGRENAEIRKKFEGNQEGYTAALVAKCTIYPDLHNAELQDSYGVKTAEELVQTMLISGEYNSYTNEVLKANKFGVTPEQVDEAKNS